MTQTLPSRFHRPPAVPEPKLSPARHLKWVWKAPVAVARFSVAVSGDVLEHILMALYTVFVMPTEAFREDHNFGFVGCWALVAAVVFASIGMGILFAPSIGFFAFLIFTMIFLVTNNEW